MTVRSKSIYNIWYTDKYKQTKSNIQQNNIYKIGNIQLYNLATFTSTIFYFIFLFLNNLLFLCSHKFT